MNRIFKGLAVGGVMIGGLWAPTHANAQWLISTTVVVPTGVSLAAPTSMLTNLPGLERAAMEHAEAWDYNPNGDVKPLDAVATITRLRETIAGLPVYELESGEAVITRSDRVTGALRLSKLSAACRKAGWIDLKYVETLDPLSREQQWFNGHVVATNAYGVSHDVACLRLKLSDAAPGQ